MTMTQSTAKKQDARTKAIYLALKDSFPNLGELREKVVYLYNPVAIRVRVIDESFEGLGYRQRHQRVMKALADLPEDVTGDMTMLLALTPAEVEKGRYIVNEEFDDPSRSRL